MSNIAKAMREVFPYQYATCSTHTVYSHVTTPVVEFIGMDSYLTPGKCKCSYCGQYGSRQSACTHCGAVIE